MKRNLVVISMLLCLIIYTLYRPTEVYLHQYLLTYFDLGQARIYAQQQWSLYPWMIYSLPGGLWVFSCTLLSFDSSYLHQFLPRMLTILLPFALCLGIEGLQYLQWTNGQYCSEDLLLYVVFFLLALLCKNRRPIQIPMVSGIYTMALALIWLSNA